MAAVVLPSVKPPVNGEDIALVVPLASEMPPGAAGVAAGAGLPNPSPGPPQMKTKFKAVRINFDTILNLTVLAMKPWNKFAKIKFDVQKTQIFTNDPHKLTV